MLREILILMASDQIKPPYYSVLLQVYDEKLSLLSVAFSRTELKVSQMGRDIQVNVTCCHITSLSAETCARRNPLQLQ